MTAQVIFLNHFYDPGKEERDRLERLQGLLELYHAELDFKTKGLNEYQKMITKEASHHETRRRWRLIRREEK